jgi:hypothetical protein
MNRMAQKRRALGQAVLVYLAIASSAATAQDTQPGRGTFAEMVAFARLGSVACQRLAPDVEGFHALALLRLIKPPLTDNAIVAKEKESQTRGSGQDLAWPLSRQICIAN